VLAAVIGLGFAAYTDGDHTAAALSGEFAPSKNIWIARDALMALPTSGAAWDRVAADATSDWGMASIADQDSNHDVLTLAGALYAVRMNDTSMRAKTVAAIESAVGTEAGGRTLALARNLTGYVIAADIVGYQSDRFSAWLRTVRLVDLEGRTLVSTHADRPNNWGTHAGAARIATDRYLGDDADLSQAVAVFRGFLGDRGAYAGFEFGDPEWQADPSAPVPINPAGATKNGINVDGAIVDDIRRCECSVSSPAPKENYQWEAMQGIIAQAELLRAAGHHDVWSWSDAAIRRAVDFLYGQANFPAEGDDSFLTYLIDANLGTAYSTGVADRPGKSFGYTGWTHGTTPLPPPSPATSTPLPVVTTAPTTVTTTAPTTVTTTAPTTVATTPTTSAPPDTTAPTTVATTPTTTAPPVATTDSSTASVAVEVAGSATGSYRDTWTRGDGSHTITEMETKGRRAKRFDAAELRWAIPALGGHQVLDVVMTVGPDAGDGDTGFLVEWSPDGVDWTPIALVASKTTLDLIVDIGSPTLSVHVRVVDSNRNPGEYLPDWVSVDLLRVRTAPGG
jgi:hypothetical protein